MITVISPAKTMNMKKSESSHKFSCPVFIDEACELMNELRKHSPPEMESILKINEELAEANFMRHMIWSKNHNIDNSKQALLSYHGAVFQGIRADEFNDEQLDFAQQHLRILSAVYGVLRPLDLIQPYRLEMGTKLQNSRGRDLYFFWKQQITDFIYKELEIQDRILINLASGEYFTSIDSEVLNARIVTPVFKEYKHGVYKNITIYAKRARGLMTRFIIENKINTPEILKEFDEEGYSYAENLSTSDEWIFVR